jgi:hypothetical protein
MGNWHQESGPTRRPSKECLAQLLVSGRGAASVIASVSAKYRDGEPDSSHQELRQSFCDVRVNVHKIHLLLAALFDCRLFNTYPDGADLRTHAKINDYSAILLTVTLPS